MIDADALNDTTCAEEYGMDKQEQIAIFMAVICGRYFKE